MTIKDYDSIAQRAQEGDADALAALMRIAVTPRSFFAARARDALAGIGVKVTAS